MSRRHTPPPTLTVADLTRGLDEAADEVRACCLPLQSATEADLGGALFAAVPLHRQRPAATLTAWAQICVDVATELALRPDESVADLHVVEHDCASPGSMVIAQYTSRPARIILYSEPVEFAENVIDLLGWRSRYARGTVRELAIEHEKAHNRLSGAVSRELKRRLDLRAARLGRLTLRGHVLGADEVVSHSYAARRLGLADGAGLALAVALNRAATLALRVARPPALPTTSAAPSRRDLPWAS